MQIDKFNAARSFLTAIALFGIFSIHAQPTTVDTFRSYKQALPKAPYRYAFRSLHR
jgi:hypothetical protein